MVALHISLYFFHKQQHQDFTSVIKSTQDDQDCSLWEQGIQ